MYQSSSVILENPLKYVGVKVKLLASDGVKLNFFDYILSDFSFLEFQLHFDEVKSTTYERFCVFVLFCFFLHFCAA